MGASVDASADASCRMEVLRELVDGRRCLVVGSAPIDAPIEPRPGEVVVAVNGGISSVPGRIDVWVLNSRSKPAGWDAERVRLNEQMVRQGAGRSVRAMCWLPRDDEADACMAERLRRQGTTWARAWSISQLDRERLEVRAGIRTPEIKKEAISAGLFAVALCVLGGAVGVRMVGFSWEPGYAYLADVALERRGHVKGDRVALRELLARAGDRVEQSLSPGVLSAPAKEEAMATGNQGGGQAPRVTPPARTSPGPGAPSAAPAAARPQRVKVRATRTGYYGELRRRPGDVFVLKDHQHDFSARWMEEVAPSTPERQSTPLEALRREHAGIMTGKAPQLQPNAADLIPEEDKTAGGEGPEGGKGDDVL